MCERTDEALEQVRETRERISAQFAHDPKRLVAYYMELQKQYAERLIAEAVPAETPEQKAA